jgi:hypothetical protein
MMADLPPWLVWGPHHPGDPGPEVYRLLTDLGPEQQRTVVATINAARAELEAVRAKGYQQIGAAIGKAAQG